METGLFDDALAAGGAAMVNFTPVLVRLSHPVVPSLKAA
jgi:hypothetical protein